jgi:serine/threonine protein kinase
VLAGRYELREELGRGGMATVYEAHDGLLDRAVAVKVLRVDDEATARQRFAAEARNAASLTHPHAVAVYDVNTASDQPFIVMELVRGDTLEDVLEREGRLDTEHVVAVGGQVLAALHTAHRRGLVHRDVKPANILLPDGVVPARPDQLPGVKLADFGIAKAMHDATVGLTMVGQVIGTPKYLSPEQVKGERATPRSDIYATGVVLYEMLAGRPPFEHDSAVGLALAHREDDPPPLAEQRPDLDPNLVALVHQALSKDPEERPADANEMRTALLRSAPSPAGTQLLPEPDAHTQAVGVAGAPPPQAPTRPTPAPLAPPPRRRRSLQWLWALIISALLTVAVLLAVERFTEVPAPTDEPTAQEQAPADPDAGQQAPAGAGEQEQPQTDPAPAEQEQPEAAPAASEPPPDDAEAPAAPAEDATG